jgi:hypothetical protein
MPTTFPPLPPSVSGANVTMEWFLRNPPRLQRVIQELAAGYFVTDRMMSAGPRAEGGAVIYDELLATEFFTDRDVQAITPGSAFPIVATSAANPKVAAVTKWGGAALITYEEERRDRRDVLNRELTRLRNTVVRKVDTVTLAVIDANATVIANTQTSAGDWANPVEDPVADITLAVTAINNNDMGYVADTVLTNHVDAGRLLRNEDVRAMLPRERPGTNSEPGNPIINGQLNGFMGLNWISSPRVTAGTAYVFDAGAVGNVSDEVPLYSRVIRQDEHERYLIQAARVMVPYVTDPNALIKITGIAT